jgi:hypothetical protein
VDADVTRTAPFCISAGNTPVPANPKPEINSNQNAAVLHPFEETAAAIAAPAIANNNPGVMKPMMFHSSA